MTDLPTIQQKMARIYPEHESIRWTVPVNLSHTKSLNMPLIDMPEPLAHMQIFNTRPVPYAQLWIDGEPTYRQLDKKKLEACAKFRLCSMCGKKHSGKYNYLVSEQTLHKRVTTDPPMHFLCAHYALAACPHLYYENGNMEANGNVKILHKQFIKPKKFYLLTTTHYKIQLKKGQLLFGFKVPKDLRMFFYEDNQIKVKI